MLAWVLNLDFAASGSAVAAGTASRSEERTRWPDRWRTLALVLAACR